MQGMKALLFNGFCDLHQQDTLLERHFLYFLAHGGSILELVLVVKNVKSQMNRNSTTLPFCCDEKIKNVNFGLSFT